MVTSQTASQKHWVEMAAQHADDFVSRVAQHDRENSFPIENFAALRVPAGRMALARKRLTICSSRCSV